MTMSRIIRNVAIKDRLLDPAQAELRIEVELGETAPAVEIVGRLMGPHCLYSNTIQIAYPLRPLAETADERVRSFRVIIPEPSLWEPESPFLYEGPLEAWQGSSRVAQILLRHGLRALTLGPRGLRINGHQVRLHGVATAAVKPDDLASMRRRGVNLLVVSASIAVPAVELADRHGFLVLVKGSAPLDGVPEAQLAEHPSWLGCVDEGAGAMTRQAGVTIHVGPSEEVGILASQGLPALAVASAPPAQPGLLGWIEAQG
jgi:beta-galactosidase/beta-glucuronidase